MGDNKKLAIIAAVPKVLFLDTNKQSMKARHILGIRVTRKRIKQRQQQRTQVRHVYKMSERATE